MADDEEPPSDDDVSKLDWAALSASARALLRFELQGFQPADIEDAAQEVCKRMVEFVHRRGVPDRPEGLMVCIVRRVTATRIAERQRERRRQGGTGEPPANEPSTEDAAKDIEDEITAIAAIICEFIRLKCPDCLAMVEAIKRGESFKDFVAREGRSYAQVVKAWSRCREKLHDAIRKGRLRLNWPTPRKKKRKPRDE
jgi:hypothetical protein